jgi:hypothetical protein
MNLVLAGDNVTSKELEALAPHKSSLSLNKPRTLSRSSRLPKPATSTIANWYYFRKKEDTSPDKLAFMESISY